MKVTITIDCDNAAFEDGAGREVVRILKRLIKRIEEDGSAVDDWFGVALMDVNGNKVGKMEVEG